jgi:hypothetical protein
VPFKLKIDELNLGFFIKKTSIFLLATIVIWVLVRYSYLGSSVQLVGMFIVSSCISRYMRYCAKILLEKSLAPPPVYTHALRPSEFNS